MATSVTISWMLQPQDFPFGTVADHFDVGIGGGVADVSVAPDQMSALFPDVPAGTYTASVQLKAADGSALGAAALSSPFDVHPAMVSLEVAMGVSGAQNP